MGTPTLAFKAAGSGGVAVDAIEVREDEGIVTAVVSVTGVVDEVDDIIEPGAYGETLAKRRPKVCWHHSWDQPVGRVLAIKELLPGDPHLPSTTQDGQPWPPEAGALVATMQFNMGSDRGREAFSAVKFYSETGEAAWSIGYAVPKGKSTRDGQGVRHIKMLDLFELSFVLFGAHTMTGTLALKAAVMVMEAAKDGGAVTVDALTEALRKVADPDDDEDEPPVVVTDPSGQDSLFDADPSDDTGPAAEGEPSWDGVDLDAESAVPDDVTLPDVPDEEDEPNDSGEPGAATKALLALGDPWYLDMRVPEGKRDLTVEQRRRKPTLPGSDTAWPIGDREDLRAAIRSFGRAKPSERGKVKRWIVRRARELGLVNLLPESWNVTKVLPSDADTGIEATCPGCHDTVLFDTMNGWMRKDGSYSHDDGTTHSDHMDPPDEYKADGAGNAEQLRRYWTVGAGGVKIRWNTPGDMTRCMRLLREHLGARSAGYCANLHKRATGTWPGERASKALPGTDVPLDPDRMAAQPEPEHTGVMVAVYPDPETAEKIRVRGGEPADELHVTLAYLGNVGDQAGETLTLGAAGDQIVAAVTAAAAGVEPLTGTVGGIGRFPEEDDGVPVWAPVDMPGLGALREAVVTALTDSGLPVKADHGFTPHMTLGYNLDLALVPPLESVPLTVDRLVVAVGDTRQEVRLGTDAGRGAPAAEPLPTAEPVPVKSAVYDPTLEVGPDAGHRPPVPAQVKGYPRPEGTVEDLQERLRVALSASLLPERSNDERGEALAGLHLEILGTYPDRVVALVHDWTRQSDESQAYEVPYTTDPSGEPILGEPEEVTLSVVVEHSEGADVPVGDMMPLANMVEIVTAGLRTLDPVEVKAGRVLSAANAQQLRTAVEHLINVLAAAGIQVGGEEKPPAPDTVEVETTAPSARGEKQQVVDAAELKALLDDIDAAATT